MPNPIRQKRVADRIQQELSDLLQTMNDPRLQLVTVTVVNIDRELEYANVFVSTVGDEERQREVLQALNHAKGFIRREVSRRVKLRRAPEIIFHWDPSPEKAEHIAALLDQLRSEAPPAETPPTTGDEAESSAGLTPQPPLPAMEGKGVGRERRSQETPTVEGDAEGSTLASPSTAPDGPEAESPDHDDN